MKLTLSQNKVIWCLQNGWEVICTSESKKVLICNDNFEYNITSALFFKLQELDLIFQKRVNKQMVWDWQLTDLGKSIKTKPMEPIIIQTPTL